jgi:hypothetical protein
VAAASFLLTGSSGEWYALLTNMRGLALWVT